MENENPKIPKFISWLILISKIISILIGIWLVFEIIQEFKQTKNPKKPSTLLQKALICYSVDLPGFEPRKPEPKTGVLPLHHRSIPKCDAKVSSI